MIILLPSEITLLASSVLVLILSIIFFRFGVYFFLNCFIFKNQLVLLFFHLQVPEIQIYLNQNYILKKL